MGACSSCVPNAAAVQENQYSDRSRYLFNTMIAGESTEKEYEVGKVLGSGEFGVVRLATRQSDNKQFAIKIPKWRCCGEDIEAAALQAFQRAGGCPYVVALEEFALTDGYPMLWKVAVLELCSSDLQTFTRRYKLPAETRMVISHQLLTAVAFCHRNKFAHRDISLQNILLSFQAHCIKLSDFGLASIVCASTNSVYVRADLDKTARVIMQVWLDRGRKRFYFDSLRCELQEELEQKERTSGSSMLEIAFRAIFRAGTVHSRLEELNEELEVRSCAMRQTFSARSTCSKILAWAAKQPNRRGHGMEIPQSLVENCLLPCYQRDNGSLQSAGLIAEKVDSLITEQMSAKSAHFFTQVMAPTLFTRLMRALGKQH